jgi:hypothetical protein
MKKLILITILFFLCIQMYAQVRMYRSYATAFRFYDYQINDWEEWGDWQTNSIYISVDATNERIDIYSSVTQKLFVISTDEIVSQIGYSSLRFHCLDQEGKRCYADMVQHDSGQIHLYIRYSDIQIGYEMEKL